jgi:hypothetical protein
MTPTATPDALAAVLDARAVAQWHARHAPDPAERADWLCELYRLNRAAAAVLARRGR